MSDLALPISRAPELPLAERLLSDERLARLASRGSSRAFAVLYERHHQAIYRYCRSIVRHDHDAQDALQNAMLRAYAALRARERDLAVRPWLFRIAHNEAVSILRRRGPVQAPSEERESLDGGVERRLEARERLATLVRDLQTLPERQRAALLMRELSGLSIAEIAGALSISEGAAKQTLFAARSSLQEYTEGRAMECESVRQAISHRDGRLLRGRRIGSHLRACAGCREFRAAIRARETDLRALAPPLPPAAAGALLARLLAHGGNPHAGAAATASTGTALGGHAAPMLVKGLAGVATLALATTGAVHLVRQHGSEGTRPAGALGGRSAGAPGFSNVSGRAGPGARPGSPGRGPHAAASRGSATGSARAHARALTGAAYGAGLPATDATGAGGDAAQRGRGRSSSKPAAGARKGHPGAAVRGRGQGRSRISPRATERHGSPTPARAHSTPRAPAPGKPARESHGQTQPDTAGARAPSSAGEAPAPSVGAGVDRQQAALTAAGR